MSTVKVTGSSWSNEVIKSETPVVVDVWAEWCGPCKQIGPALEELSEAYVGKVKIVKVDADDAANQPIMEELGVRGIPALFIFNDGKQIASKVGAAPKATIDDWIADHIA